MMHLWDKSQTFCITRNPTEMMILLKTKSRVKVSYREIHAVWHQRKRHSSASRSHKMLNKTYLSSLRKSFFGYWLQRRRGKRRKILSKRGQNLTQIPLIFELRSCAYDSWNNISLSKNHLMEKILVNPNY